MKRDIENREDIDLLMQLFYSEAMRDDVIGYMFTDVAHLDLDHHLPVIGDFWENVLFRTANYGRHGRNPMQVHLALNDKEPLKTEHFNRWLEIFYRLIDENFEGLNAEILKERSAFMAERILTFATGGLPRMNITVPETRAGAHQN